MQADAGRRCCSCDGDADRLVYFIPSPAAGQAPDLLDGDRISILAADYIGQLVRQLPAEVASKAAVGVVQTAYANGASTRYLRETLGVKARSQRTGTLLLRCQQPREKLGLQVAMAKTGVKHLHAAAEHFPLGVYFEANGHGTVLFHHGVLKDLESLAAAGDATAQRLLVLARMINQAVGDALSCILLVEAVLRLRRWTPSDWLALYSDLPSKNLKVVVPDRTFIKCSADETRVVDPAPLQAALDAEIAKYPQGRAFARPSGEPMQPDRSPHGTHL